MNQVLEVIKQRHHTGSRPDKHTKHKILENFKYELDI